MPIPSAGSTETRFLQDAGKDQDGWRVADGQSHQLALMREGLYTMQAETNVDGQQPMRDPSAGSPARRFLQQLAVEAKVDVEQPMANPIRG